jgi:hypothetical protein
MITLNDFQQDFQGNKFADVIRDPRLGFQPVVDFFNDPARIRRLEDSELHHDRPPLAGVIREFESVPVFRAFLSGYDAHTTRRFRQAVGVLIRLHMECLGWRTTGGKGSLGTRAKVPTGTTTPGAYCNTSGLSKWFTSAKRYER